jgi:hypothetical protein
MNGEVLNVSLVKKISHTKHKTIYSGSFPIGDTDKLTSFFLILMKYGVDIDGAIERIKNEV